jgi:hypothetical protein
MRLRGKVGKYVLRQAMKDRVPSAMELKKHPFMAPAAETLGLDRGSSDLGRYLDRDVTARVGIFDPTVIALIRRGLRILPTDSYARSLAETMVTIVASVHVLDELFCEQFERSAERFGSTRRARLQDGLVSKPAAPAASVTGA